MLVKNITGIQRTYSYLSLTLDAGATGTVDDAFIENDSLQADIANSLISIISYTKSNVNQTITISTAKSPTEPSQDQKGALVTSDTPSAGNPFVTNRARPIHDIRLVKDTGSAIKLKAFKSQKYTIGDTLFDFDSDFSTVISSATPKVDAAASAAGTITVDTFTYVYLKSDGFIFSNVAPSFDTNGLYLNSSRDHLFVGWILTNASGDLDKDFDVCSYFNEEVSTHIIDRSVATVNAVSGSTFEEVHTLTVLVPPESVLRVDALFPIEDTSSGNNLEWALGDTAIKVWQSESVANEPVFGQGVFVHERTATTPAKLTVKTWQKGPATSHSSDKNLATVIFERYNVNN